MSAPEVVPLEEIDPTGIDIEAVHPHDSDSSDACAHHHHAACHEHNASEHEEMQRLLLTDPTNCDLFHHLVYHPVAEKEDHGHHHHHHDHDHGHVSGVTWRLISMIILTGGFFFVELIYGYAIGSLSLQSDAFHMFSDVGSLVIGLYAHRLSKQKPNDVMTFGYNRAEVVGGLINAVFLLTVCLTIFIEAVQRYISPEDISSPDAFLTVGVIGLVVNLLGLCLFHEHGDSENLEGVFLHIVGDTLGSVAVIASACATKWADWSWKNYIDPSLSLLIVLMLINGAYRLLKKTVRIVMEAAPADVSQLDLHDALMSIEGLVAIHDFHIWELGKKNYVANLHIVVDNKERNKVILCAVTNVLLRKGVYSSTIQSEFAEDFPAGVDCSCSCSYATTFGQSKRVFDAIPAYVHNVGCNHANIPPAISREP